MSIKGSNGLPAHHHHCSCLVLSRHLSSLYRPLGHFDNIKTLDENRKKATSELIKILDWLHANRLSLNINKTNFNIFGPQCSAHDYSSCTIRLHGQDIKHVNECKFLGIYLDTHLTWKRHIERISAKISSAIFAINRARNFLSKRALRCLYFALVHSHLTYGIHVWGNSMTIIKIITLQKRAIRTINKVWYRSNTEPLFKSNRILTFEDMYTMQISLFVYDLNNDLLPNRLEIYYLKIALRDME